MSDGQAQSITVQDAFRRSTDGLIQIIDVRTPEEFAACHAPGALNVPLSDLASRTTELPPEPICCICMAGQRSAAAIETLDGLGRTGIPNVAGGMNAWVAAGLPVTEDAPNPGRRSFLSRLLGG